MRIYVSGLGGRTKLEWIPPPPPPTIRRNFNGHRSSAVVIGLECLIRDRSKRLHRNPRGIVIQDRMDSGRRFTSARARKQGKTKKNSKVEQIQFQKLHFISIAPFSEKQLVQIQFCGNNLTRKSISTFPP